MKDTIIVTGGAGFIGSAMVWKLNQLGIDRILVVDELGSGDKWKNLSRRRFLDYLHKDQLISLVARNALPTTVRAVIHMGACSSTTERDAEFLMQNNFRYTKTLAEWCISRAVRFVYASSAATYGAGEKGYDDDEALLRSLRPLNMYGYSKQLFDQWALQTRALTKIVGLKFFNVYGPQEYHKDDMRSVVQKSWEQIREKGSVNLFKSYRPEYEDGGQKRDFVYVKDCVEVMAWLLSHPSVNGIYNLGSGNARTWNDLVRAVFASMGREEAIRYIEMPESLRDQYQYFTEAPMTKLRRAGYSAPFFSLEEGVRDYVMSYLETGERFL